MKILHIARACTHGGIETFLANLIPYMQKNGIEFETYFYDNAGAEDIFKGLCKYYFKEDRWLADVLANGDYDIVHIVPNVLFEKLNTAIKLSRYNRAIIITIHQCGYYNSSIPYDRVVAVSKAVAASISDKVHRPLEVIYNGVETSKFYPPDFTSEDISQKPIIAWVGRSYDEVKRVNVLLDFARSISGRNFHVIMIDGGYERGYDISKIPDNLEVITQKPFAEMPDFYRKVVESRGFLLSTSLTEACPISFIEAQACGCPIIAPNVGGIPEVVEHLKTGYLYPVSASLDDINQGITWLYNEANYDEISCNAVENVKNKFTSQIMAENYYKLYSELYNKYLSSKRPAILRKILLRIFGQILVLYNNMLAFSKAKIKKVIKRA